MAAPPSGPSPGRPGPPPPAAPMHPFYTRAATMIGEIAAAVSFISKFLRTKGLTSERQLQTFSQSLQELLAGEGAGPGPRGRGPPAVGAARVPPRRAELPEVPGDRGRGPGRGPKQGRTTKKLPPAEAGSAVRGPSAGLGTKGPRGWGGCDVPSPSASNRRGAGIRARWEGRGARSRPGPTGVSGRPPLVINHRVCHRHRHPALP